MCSSDLDRDFEVVGEFAEFMDFWLDGQKLVKDVDYTAESGSTKITVRSQTFEKAGTGNHTIAAEYRVDGDIEKDLKRAAQNYTLETRDGSSSSNTSGGTTTTGSVTIPDVPQVPAGPVIVPVVPTGERDSIYNDVFVNAWYYADIRWAYTNKLIVGVSETSFAPNEATEQSMAVTVLARAHKADLKGYNYVLDQVLADRWYTRSMLWAEANGLLEGIKISPDSKMTRQELAILLVNYFKYIEIELPSTTIAVEFNDSELIASEAQEAMQMLYQLGIYTGRGNGKMAPTSTVTRAELAAVLRRVLNLIEQK